VLAGQNALGAVLRAIGQSLLAEAHLFFFVFSFAR
jgi:hypothetical protein